QDFHGTNRFTATFVAASKEFTLEEFGQFDLTLGFGNGRFDGAFGGVRWRQPWLPNVALVAEYDGYDYSDDFYQQRTGDIVREGGLTLGVEYTRNWVSGQLSHQDGEWGFNAS